MKKWFLLIFVLGVYTLGYAQSTYAEEDVITVQDKNADYVTEREFSTTPKSKYNDGSFQYVEDGPAKKYKRQEQQIEIPKKESGFTIFGLSPIVFFFILFAVLAVVALLFGFDFSYLKLQQYRQKVADPLIVEEEEIDEGDYEKLLKRAIQQKDFRLATRYYYLWLLKRLSQKEYIDYHKDKTNSDYLFELKDAQVRSQFSYVSYIYSYVWYGEFPVDESKFATIKQKYQSFMNQIK
jgi:hypothetical protein